MLKRMVLAACFVLAPTICWAQGQENYLPPKTQFYFRFDGMSKHQAAFDKTAVGKMMQGETGAFIDELCKYVQANAQTAAQAADPKASALLKDFSKLFSTMYQHGLVMGLEVDEVLPQPKVQAVLVFPKGAGESGTLLPLVQKIAEESPAKVQSAKVGKRIVNTVQVQLLQVGWWAQGDDAVLYLGTLDPVAFAKDIDSKKAGIAFHPLFKKVIAFKEFPTTTRGYFDMGSVLNVASNIRPEVGKIIDELGIKGVKSITFASGFDGPAERSIVDVDMASERKGLLSLGSKKKLTLEDLPALPNDINGFTASTISMDKSYDVITGLINNIAGVVAPGQAGDIKDAIKNFENTLGVDINKDFFGNFGDVMVTYSSPSDGFLGTGSVVAIQIKDGKKMEKTLEKLIKAIPAFPGGEFTLKKKTYQGGTLMQLQMSGQANSLLASFGIYKGWFVYAQLPQPIKGFILRQEGVLPAWKADPELTKVLAQFPKEYNVIKVSDPRPTVQTLLSIAPFVLNLANQVGGGLATAQLLPGGYRPFDVELVPHAQEATRHLFPNVTISIDDGKRIRSETRASLSLGF